MKSTSRRDLLVSLGLVAGALGALEAPALRAAMGAEMAELETRLVLLRARLQAGSTSAGLLAGVRLFIEDFEALFSRFVIDPER